MVMICNHGHGGQYCDFVIYALSDACYDTEKLKKKSYIC